MNLASIKPKEKQRMNTGILQKALFVTLFLSAIAFSAPVTAEGAQTAGCQFMLSFDDWRITAFLGLILGIILIGFIYMYGSAVDNSFIARAKNELYQIIFTAVLLVSITAIVGFMCDDVIADLFGLDGSTYAAAETYLTKLSSFLGYSVIGIGALGSSLQILSGTGISDGYVPVSKTLQLISDPVGYFSKSTFVLYGIILTAYLLTIVQLHVIKIVPYMALFFLIPIGIVLRSIFPFRKFGGALLGTGIAIYVLIPFVLLLNHTMVNTYIDQPSIASLTCTDDSQCFSHMCRYDQVAAVSKCVPLKTTGESCEADDQCQSGYCIQTASGKNCSACGTEGSSELPCCEGFVKNPATGKCELAKKNGESCTENKECISGICTESPIIYSTLSAGTEINLNQNDGGKICVPKKSNGDACSVWTECVSRFCTGVAPNKACNSTIMTEDDTNYLIASAYSSYTGSVSSQLQILEFVGDIKTYVKKTIDWAVVSLIAGILLPILNLTVISKGMKDLSGALGSEMDLASIWKLV